MLSSDTVWHKQQLQITNYELRVTSYELRISNGGKPLPFRVGSKVENFAGDRGRRGVTAGRGEVLHLGNAAAIRAAALFISVATA